MVPRLESGLKVVQVEVAWLGGGRQPGSEVAGLEQGPDQASPSREGDAISAVTSLRVTPTHHSWATYQGYHSPAPHHARAPWLPTHMLPAQSASPESRQWDAVPIHGIVALIDDGIIKGPRARLPRSILTLAPPSSVAPQTHSLPQSPHLKWGSPQGC